MQTLVGKIMTSNGKNMLTAAKGGGLGGPDSGPGTVALHTDATSPGAWETYRLILQAGSPAIGQGMQFALQTSDGTHYLTAVDGGGIGGPDDATCPVHTDAAFQGPWETFTLLVDDTVNPPTVQIKSFAGLPLPGSYFLTAVNGGDVTGTGNPPVQTNRTAANAWETFTFSWSPIVINFNTNINGPFQGNIAGSISLTMAPDGSFCFSGQDNNSNWLPYDMTVALVVKSSQGNVFAFTTSGNIDAGLPGDDNNWSWNICGDNATIQAKWSELMAGYTWFYNISASLSLQDLFNGVIAAAKAAGPIVQSVVAVVGALS